MRKRYHVTQRPDGEWQGRVENGGRASVVAGTQGEVVSRMAQIADEKMADGDYRDPVLRGSD